MQVNEYNPGQGIMAHEDGPLYFPLVAILSLGSSAVIRFTKRRDFGASAGEGAHDPGDSQVSLVLRPRSLLLFSGAAYTGEYRGLTVRVMRERLQRSVSTTGCPFVSRPAPLMKGFVLCRLLARH